MVAMRGVARVASRIRFDWLVVGTALVCAFFALDRTSNTIRVTFMSPWDASSRGELYFWLAAIMFLLPGSTLIGASLAGVVGPLLERVHTRLSKIDARERLALVITLGLLAWTIARIGNQVVLQGQPFTDDEDASRFGGQVLATGALWAPLPPMRHAFPELFLFQRDGAWTSFDFVGALLPWTLSELTGSGTLVFSVLAALAPAAVMSAVMRRDGTSVGLLAGILLACSPMAATLSLTSHAHVVSRGFLALGLGLILFVDRASLRRSFVAGVAFGFALLTRPPETSALLAPLALGYVYEAARSPAQRPRLWGLALGSLPLVLAMLAYNHALSGSFGFLRGAANEIHVPYGSMMGGPLDFERWRARFGNNLAYNVLTLSLWFLGPLGLVLAWWGRRASRTHLLLGLGVLLAFCLCMLHDDRGLHMVGPIHLSETAVPLVILASAGLKRAFDGLHTLTLPRAVYWSGALGYLTLGLLVFAGWHMRALGQQAAARVSVVGLAEHVEHTPAIVLAPPFGSVRAQSSPYGQVGGFVFEWRRARPDLSEPVLIVRDSSQARAEVREAFPARAPYVYDPQRYGVFPVPLAEALEIDRTSAAPP